MSAEKFKSKKGFILASIGAAVGLGNALRFPGLCAKYGGGTFLFIYFIALIVLGIPLLNAEIALGRKLKGAAPTCMSALTSRRPKLGAGRGLDVLPKLAVYRSHLRRACRLDNFNDNNHSSAVDRRALVIPYANFAVFLPNDVKRGI